HHDWYSLVVVASFGTEELAHQGADGRPASLGLPESVPQLQLVKPDSHREFPRPDFVRQAYGRPAHRLYRRPAADEPHVAGHMVECFAAASRLSRRCSCRVSRTGLRLPRAALCTG